MIRRIFNHPHIIWQSADEDDGVPNDAIAACLDNGGTICLHQGGSELVINKATVPDLCKVLKQLASVKA